MCKKKFYAQEGSPESAELFCYKCLETRDATYRVIHDALRDHPQSNLATLHELTGIPFQLLYHVVNSDNFQWGGRGCSECGRPVPSAKSSLCTSCANTKTKKLQERLPERIREEILQLVSVDSELDHPIHPQEERDSDRRRYGFSRGR